MQRNQSAPTTDRPLPRGDDDRRNRVAAATEPTRPAPEATDPAEFFRRLDRQRPRRPAWMTAVAIGVLAVVAVGGAIAYHVVETPSAPPRHAQALFISPGK
jgi:hypothetical protein